MIDYKQWLTKYLTGVEKIDNQHLQLAEHLNTIEHLLEKPFTETDITGVLDQLSDYFEQHFVYEEMLLQNHPDLAKHHAEHQKFIAKTEEFKKEVLVKKNQEVARDMLSFLYVWFLSHTLKMDKAHLLKAVKDHL